MSSQIKLPVSFKDRLPVAEDLPFFAYSTATPTGEKPPAVCGWLGLTSSASISAVAGRWHSSYTHFLPRTDAKPTQTPDQMIAEFVGEGYRLLEKNEKVVEGDEWADRYGPVLAWKRTLLQGSLPAGGFYRRKVAASATATKKPNLWRQLDPSEKVLEGDVLVEATRLDHVTVDLTADEIPCSRPSLNWKPQRRGAQASLGVYFRRLPVGLPEPVKLAVDPGEGYVLLAEGTKLEVGDEYYDADEDVWGKTNYAGERNAGDKGCTYPYRRKIKAATPAIDPGAGYRLLGDDEEILPTDEYFNPDTTTQWNRDIDGNSTPRERRSGGFSGLQFRRKITIPAGYRTLKVGELFAATDKAFYKSSGQIRDRASWIVGNVVKDHDLIPGLPILWLRPLVTEATFTPVFKVGDRVRLLGGWGDSPSNPIWDGPHGKVVGTITSLATTVIALPLVVLWDNGQNNSYRKSDLGLHVDEQLPHHKTGKLPPAGYRWLEEGEKREVGDVYDPSLNPVMLWTIGHSSENDCILRPLATAPAPAVPFPAKICPGIPPAGYRFLCEGEIVRVGDRVARRHNSGKSYSDPVTPDDTFRADEDVRAAGSWNNHVVGKHGSDFTTAPFVRELDVLVSGTTTVAESGVSWGTVVNKSIVGVVIDPRDKKIAELEDHVANLQRKGQRQREALNKQQDSIRRLNEQRAQESMERGLKNETNARDVREVFNDRPDRLESLQELSRTPGCYQVLNHEEAKALTSYVDALESTLTRIAL